MKYVQPLIGAIFGLLGLYLIVHFLGHLALTDLASMVIGFGLLAVGVLSLILFFRRQSREKSRN